MSRTPAQEIRALYRQVDGFDIPRSEEKDVAKSGGDPLYGELTPGGAATMIQKLELGPRDVFYDLGSGSGKVVLQVAMTLPVKRCVGYELSETRCRQARSRLLAARKKGLVQAKRCAFYPRDLMSAPMDDATVIYTCSTAFSNRFMRRLMQRLLHLPAPVTLATLRDLDDHKRFELVDCHTVATNWERRSPLFVYRVTPRP